MFRVMFFDRVGIPVTECRFLIQKTHVCIALWFWKEQMWEEGSQEEGTTRKTSSLGKTEKAGMCVNSAYSILLQQVLLQLEKSPSQGQGWTVVPWRDKESRRNARFEK